MSKKGIDIQQIIELYNQVGNIQIVAEKFNCTNSNISRRLKRAGVDISRDYSKRRLPIRGIFRHIVDELFFDIIDSEEKAYFLGLMYSDGSVSKNLFYLKLKDEDIIIKFRDSLKCDYPIIRREDPYISYCLTVSSTTLCKQLIRLGCTQNKTKTIRMPILRNDLIRHFLRGFYDGDGSLILHDKSYHNCFNITSASKLFLLDIQPIIRLVSLTNGGISKETKYDVWHLRFCGKLVKLIMDWLYDNSSIYLNRKYLKYRVLSPL